MPDRHDLGRAQRHCLDPRDIQHLAREGIGWGHDLDCGCFRAEGPARTSWLSRLTERIGLGGGQ